MFQSFKETIIVLLLSMSGKLLKSLEGRLDGSSLLTDNDLLSENFESAKWVSKLTSAKGAANNW